MLLHTPSQHAVHIYYQTRFMFKFAQIWKKTKEKIQHPTKPQAGDTRDLLRDRSMQHETRGRASSISNVIEWMQNSVMSLSRLKLVMFIKYVDGNRVVFSGLDVLGQN